MAPRPNKAPYDLDDEVDFAACAARLKRGPVAENFVVRFDTLHAECAIDVDRDEALKWLDRQQQRQPYEPRQEQQQNEPQGEPQTQTQTQDQHDPSSQQQQQQHVPQARRKEPHEQQPQPQPQQQQGQPRGTQTALWMNFWAAESQREIIRAVAEKYDLSPRLVGLLCPTGSSSSQSTGSSNDQSPGSGTGSSSSSSGAPDIKTTTTQANGDVEKGTLQHQHPAPAQLLARKPTGFAALRGLTFGDVVRDLWHFCSVDFGRHYIYVGFNALYSLPKGDDGAAPGDSDDNDDEDDDDATTAGRHARRKKSKSKFGGNGFEEFDNGDARSSQSKPSGQRIWTSLLICDDGTVVSVFERPATGMTPELHAITSRNVLNVFRHLSRHHDQGSNGANAAQDALMKVRVRWVEQKHQHHQQQQQQQHSTTSTDGTTNSTNTPAANASNNNSTYDATEAASLLFYYLFDDWLSTYALIARLEHPYRERLEEMRRLMFEAADVGLIKQVHDVGRQLTVLKLMYQSYELIVSRLLHRARGTGAGAAFLPPSLPGVDSFASSSLPLSMSSTAAHQMRLVHNDTAAARLAQDYSQSDYNAFRDPELAMSGVKLSLSAVVRFERLLDRIRLYALTEIEECLREKEALVLMVSSIQPEPRIQVSMTDLAQKIELQLGRPEGVTGRRTSHAHHDPARKGHHPVPPGQFDDGILLHSTP